MIPTYNEAANIVRLIGEILPLDDSIEILVVDDNSPDGTWKLVQEIANQESRVHLLLRTQKKGRGVAGIEGLQKALEMDADRIIEMDADFSHNPCYIENLIKATDSCDVAIGSRFIGEGRDVDRGLVRRMITICAGLYVRVLLGIRIRDVSSGYRCFRREVLQKIDLGDIISAGPSIVLEILFKIILAGFSIQEVPIIFEDRRQGETKLDWITLLETFVMVLRLRKMKRDGLIKIGPL